MAKVAPLSWQTPIVDGDSGKPTSYFIRLWQQLFSIQYIRIVADRTIIKYDAGGTATPSSQTTTFTASKTNASDTTTWTLKDNLGNPLSISAYTTGSDTDTVTMTRPQFDAALAVNGSSGVRVIASIDDAGETFRDEASLTKVQDGATGTGLNARILTVYSDKQTIIYDGSGTPTPTVQTTTFGVNKVNSTATVFWTIQDLLGNNLTPVTTYLSASSGDTVTMTRTQFEAACAVNSARGVIVTGTMTDSGTYVDRISVVKILGGADGSTGAPGPTGTASYLHTAYSDAADGSVNFTTADIPGGRTYIGFYVDTTAADSTNPASYNWSQFVGEDGSNGSPGLNGYVHRAYADSSDGSVNFTTGSPGSRTYIGWYQDNVLADSTSYASYTWSKFVGSNGSPGSPGSPGAPGITPLSMSALPNPITVGCTNNGTPKAAIPDFTVTVLQATTDVTASVSWSFTSSGLTSPSRAGAVFSALGMTADTGYITATATYGGASASLTVTYTKTFDGAAFVTQTDGIAAPTTSVGVYDTCSTGSLLMGPGGNLDFDGNGFFSHSGGGSDNFDGHLEYSLNGGSTWSTLSGSTFTGNPALVGSPGDFSFTGTVTGASISLTTKQTVLFRLIGRRTGSPVFNSFSGSMSVSWTG